MDIDYFKLWYEDKRSILETMNRNMYADIDVGYDPQGENIKCQLKAIDDYSFDINRHLTQFSSMKDKDVQNWCKYDMIRRGAIEP